MIELNYSAATVQPQKLNCTTSENRRDHQKFSYLHGWWSEMLFWQLIIWSKEVGRCKVFVMCAIKMEKQYYNTCLRNAKRSKRSENTFMMRRISWYSTLQWLHLGEQISYTQHLNKSTLETNGDNRILCRLKRNDVRKYLGYHKNGLGSKWLNCVVIMFLSFFSYFIFISFFYYVV